MNNNYCSSSFEDQVPSYNYSFEYSSPSTSTYGYSSFLPPSGRHCPFHTPHTYYSPVLPSTNFSPASYTYQQQSQVESPNIQQDRTPLRRHQCFKKNELQILHQAYIRDAHPSIDILRQLAVQLKVSIDKIRQWFKNRRHSDKQKRRETSTTQPSKII
ncbi:unnamed protein product [Adineta steineri]|uniref:Homeobox domain-containing protein n=1 Tax=Adineta steineri TaxID=433720 RepID=A0A815QKH7_9BILA|nr:unnamed protein product [Adineta steineri]CAF3938245.1 unnamed protein product [Adineta steineri]